MKNSMILAAAAAAVLSLSACSGNKSCDDKACTKDDKAKEMVYTGVLPAADADGVRYTLHLDYDKDGNEGDYTLLETYIKADTISATGYSDLKSLKSEGDFKVEKQGDKTYLKLVKDASGSSDAPMYFLVDSDNAITLTNAELEVSTTPGMNYTLKLAE